MTDVLVVDDSQFMRTVVGNILTDNGYAVEYADDGESAVAAAVEHEPDVVTMDVEMPGMDGIEAVERIMDRAPAPILMLSAHTDSGADATLRALSSGAVDFLPKPGGDADATVAALEDEVVDRVRALARADTSSLAPTRAAASARSVSARAERSGDGGVAAESAAADGATASETAEAPTAPGTTDAPAGTGTTGDPTATDRAATPPTPAVDRFDVSRDVPESACEGPFVDRPTVVIGASTGGPRVVERVVTGLPVDLDARILVVQHMPESFTGRFAARLDDLLPFDCREAEDGQRIRGGDLVVARGDRHMEVAHYTGGRLRLALTDDERIHGVRPAIDVTMLTAARRVTDPLVGVALTGMGKDGAAGIEAIKQAGGHTIAQDRATSPVFGIPRQAIATGCVDHVLPAEEIAAGVCAALTTEVDTDG